jgi:hypothetical protein
MKKQYFLQKHHETLICAKKYQYFVYTLKSKYSTLYEAKSIHYFFSFMSKSIKNGRFFILKV